MKKICSSMLILFLGFACWVQARQTQTQPSPSGVIEIRNVSVIDGTGAPLQKEMTVIIRGDRIDAIGRSGKIRTPHLATVIEGRGKYLIPGLWDMHVHWEDADYLPLFIANGVTGIRIMWGAPAHQLWRKRERDRLLIGPRLSIASAIIDGPIPIWPGSIGVKDAKEAREAVDAAQKSGADFIKIYTLLPRDAFFAIADETKRLGIPFAGHVPNSVSAIEASDAGQKSVEHLTGVFLTASTREDEFRKELLEAGKQGFSSLKTASRKQAGEILDTYSDDKAAELFRHFKTNHTWQCPTLTVLRSTAYLDDPNFLNDPRLKYMPASIRQFWDPKNDFRVQDRTPQDYTNAKRGFRKSLEIVGAMNRAGVPIIAGTDTLNPYCFPGFSLHDELALLTEAGLTPMQALQTATRNAAMYLGQLDSFGTIEAHKVADLVLLSANPVQDIHNTTAIDAVILGGRLFSKGQLDQMKSDAEKLASKKSIAEAISFTLKAKGAEAAIQRYRKLKATEPDAYDFSENELNNLGYTMLEQKMYDRAIGMLQLNVEVFPESANAYDSLAEAYVAAGNRDEAIRNYRKSLELNPDNTNATEKIRQLMTRSPQTQTQR